MADAQERETSGFQKETKEKTSVMKKRNKRIPLYEWCYKVPLGRVEKEQARLALFLFGVRVI